MAEIARQRLPSNPSATDIESFYPLHVCEEELPLDKDGAYVDAEAKIIINVSIKSVERRQFTLYHEFVHYLIRQDDDLYSYLHDTYEDDEKFNSTTELMCNVGAAQIILPREEVRQIIENQGVSLAILDRLCANRKVSGPAALIQLVQYAPNRCYGVICELGTSPFASQPNQGDFVRSIPVPSLYINYAIWSPSTEYPMARFTRIPRDHILLNGLSNNNLIKGIDRIPFRSGTDWRVPCEGLFFRGNVYGLFHASPQPNPEQPRLF